MAILSVVLVAAAVLCCVLYLLRKIQRKPRAGEPPLVPGHLLWGNGKEFNENAVAFLHQAEKQHGGIFTIRLLHYHMTIIADPHSLENFSRERNFDFDPIQEQVNSHVFGFKIPDSRKMIRFVGKTTRGSAVPRSIRDFHGNLVESFDLLHDSLPADADWTQDGLMTVLSQTLFRAIFNSIFGQDKETPQFNYQVFCDNLHTFHKYFNYIWLGLPHRLFPQACRALEKLMAQPTSDDIMSSPYTSEYIKAATHYLRSHGVNDAGVKGHNLVYLHVNMNTFKIAFWCAYNLLNDAAAMAALRTEIGDVVASKSGYEGGKAILSAGDIEGLKLLDSVVNESFRLASGVFMVRLNTADTEFTLSSGKTYTVRAGDKVCVYPPAIHKDGEIFENPMAFKYDRFVDRKFYKNGVELKNPVLAFGTLCPGKRIALLQVKWFLISLLTKLDIEILPGEATEIDVQYHGHEIIPPTHDVQVRYRFKREPATEVTVAGF